MPSTLQLYQSTWQMPRTLRNQGNAALQTVQLERLNEIVAYVRQHARFYAEKYASLPAKIDDVRQLPVVSKPELMPRFADWITDPAVNLAELNAFIADHTKIGHAFLGKYVVCTTSGTTGQPAILLQDEATLALMGALNILRAMPAWINGSQLLEIIRRGMRTAAIWATNGHYLGITMLKRQILQKPARARSMRTFSVLSPLSEIVAGLNEFQPAMLNGYATAIALLAQEQEAGRLHIHPVLVMTSSESLSPEDRQRVQGAFGCTIADNYGCSEFVAIAAGCKEGWLHVNSDWVIVEPVDENLNPTPPGQTSHSVLITNLINHIQPILRYNLGDRVTLRADACPCGSPFPAIKVEGRTDDVLRFTGSGGESIPVLPLALWATIKQTPGVARFQAIQTSPQRLEVRLETHDAAREAVWHALQANLQAFFAQQGLAAVGIELAAELPQRDERSGKFRHVWAQKD